MIRKRVLGSVLAGILAVSYVGGCKKEEKPYVPPRRAPPSTMMPYPYGPAKPGEPVGPAPVVPEEEAPEAEVPEVPEEAPKDLEGDVDTGAYIGRDRQRVYVRVDGVRGRFYRDRETIYNDLKVGRKFSLLSLIDKDRGVDVRFRIGRDSYNFNLEF